MYTHNFGDIILVYMVVSNETFKLPTVYSINRNSDVINIKRAIINAHKNVFLYNFFYMD